MNLVGEHTDYNEGFVLPMAIERGITVRFTRRADRVLRARSTGFGEAEITLDAFGLRPSAFGLDSWFSYVAAVAWVLRDAGHDLTGVDLLIDSTLPAGSGLSSSAALEVAVARACCEASGIEWDAVAMARLCQRAEQEFVGVACGIMDQLTVATAQRGAAMLIDCRTLVIEPVPIPDEVVVAVMDTAVPRDLAGSAYNDRRASCEAAVAAIRAIDPSIKALRDVDATLLERAGARMDSVTYRRAAHMVAENQRPAMLAQALERRDFVAAGRTMNDSHQGLRDLYEVSSSELDTIVDIARAERGCFGARMTGAGFGGCAVALVDRSAAAEFVGSVLDAYGSRTGRAGSIFTTLPAEGARMHHRRD